MANTHESIVRWTDAYVRAVVKRANEQRELLGNLPEREDIQHLVLRLSVFDRSAKERGLIEQRCTTYTLRVVGGVLTLTDPETPTSEITCDFPTLWAISSGRLKLRDGRVIEKPTGRLCIRLGLIDVSGSLRNLAMAEKIILPTFESITRVHYKGDQNADV